MAVLEEKQCVCVWGGGLLERAPFYSHLSFSELALQSRRLISEDVRISPPCLPCSRNLARASDCSRRRNTAASLEFLPVPHARTRRHASVNRCHGSSGCAPTPPRTNTNSAALGRSSALGGRKNAGDGAV